MGEIVEFTAYRICDGRFNNLGFKGADLGHRLNSGDAVCPNTNLNMSGTLESNSTFALGDELASRARAEAIKLANGWCENPCSLCGNHVNNFNIEITHLQTQS
jgi:hypothetical protein